MHKYFRKITFLGVIAIFVAVGCQTTRIQEAKAKELLPVNVKLSYLSNVFTGKEAIIVDMVFAISNPNSDNTCRQEPQGAPPFLVATAIASNSRSPALTALKIADLSAQIESG